MSIKGRIVVSIVAVALWVPACAYGREARQYADASEEKNFEVRVPAVTALRTLPQQSCAAPYAAAKTVWHMPEDYPVSAAGFRDAIAAAKKRFAQAPDDTVVLKIAPGRYTVDAVARADGSIVLSGLSPGDRGRLVVMGAGSDKTVLVFAPGPKANLYGQNTSRVSFVGIHLARDRYEVTQGRVTAIDPKSRTLDVEIDAGFPTPLDLYNAERASRRYLREYTADNPLDPRLLATPENDQVPWDDPVLVGGRVWRIKVRFPVPYRVGSLVAFKSKDGSSGQSYFFQRGSDVSFCDVKWTHVSRGVFRGFNRVHFDRCIVDRPPPIQGRAPFLASNGGGPQIGQPADGPTAGNIIENCRFIGTGDDAIGLFHNRGAIVRNNYIRDSFARGVMLGDSEDTVLDNNLLERTRVMTNIDREGTSEHERRRKQR